MTNHMKVTVFILGFKIYPETGGRNSLRRIFGVFLSDCVQSRPRRATTFTVNALKQPSLAQCAANWDSVLLLINYL